MSIKMEEVKSDVIELRRLKELATRDAVKEILNTKLQEMEAHLSTLKANAAKQSPAPQAVDLSTNAEPPTPTEKIRDYSWGQSGKYVKFYVTIPGVDELKEDEVTLDARKTDITLTVRVAGKTFIFTCGPLHKTIIPDGCSHKQKADRVTISLKKEEPVEWEFLTRDDQEKHERDEARVAHIQDEDTDDHDTRMRNMLNRIYINGDDEVKRNIYKVIAQTSESAESEETKPMEKETKPVEEAPPRGFSVHTKRNNKK